MDQIESPIDGSAQQQRWVTASFAAVALIVAYIINAGAFKAAAQFDLETKIQHLELSIRLGSVVLGFIVFFALYANQRVHQFTSEVVAELSKVTWPSQKETTNSTWIVLVFCLLIGALLGLIDKFWTLLLQWVL